MLGAMSLPASLSLALLVLLGCTPAADGEEGGWLDAGPVVDTASVNEGELVFLTGTPARRVLQTTNHLTVTPDSLASGWVTLEQCQGNLDPVPAVEIVYRYHGLRGLRITASTGVTNAVVTGNTVQLTDVRPGGEVCIAAEVRVLMPDGAGGYRLQSGPFHRRFLDGYYPLHLEYRIGWPAGRLRLAAVTPAPQPGFTLATGPDFLHIDTLFEGMLTIALQFTAGE